MDGRGLILLAAAGLCACDASLVMTRKRARGPVAEVGLIEPGAGRVRYALKGPGWLVARRRSRALGLLAKACEGETAFRVLAERDEELAETRYTEEDLDADKFLESGHYKVSSYRVLEFECVSP